MEGTAGQREVGVEVATQYSFNWTFGDGLCERIHKETLVRAVWKPETIGSEPGDRKSELPDSQVLKIVRMRS